MCPTDITDFNLKAVSKKPFSLSNFLTISYRPTGLRRIVADYVIVKPKIERLQISHGVTADDLKDFVGPRNFLTKYKGVKQMQLDAKLEQERVQDRQKRTFSKFSYQKRRWKCMELTLIFFNFYTAQAGISVITREGEKTLTIQNAQGLKSYMN